MAHIVADRVLESSTSTGTGAFALAAAVVGFRRFNAVCAVSDTVPYFIEAVDANGVPTGDWECGVGTYSAANELTRTTVLASSNAGAAVNFAAGTKYVALGGVAARSAYLDHQQALVLPSLSTPPSGLASVLKLYGISRAGRVLPGFVGPAGIDSPLQPAIFANRVATVNPQRTTAVNVFGCGAQTAATLSHPTISTASMAEHIYRTRFQTSTTAGNASGFRTDQLAMTGNGTTARGGFFFAARVMTGSIALSGGQVLLGLQGSNAALAGEPSALTNLLAIGKDIADTNLQFMRNDGAGAATKVSLEAYAANKAYDLRIFCPPGSTTIWALVERINDDGTSTALLDTSYNTDIPGNSALLAMHCQVRNGSTAAAANVEMARFYIESDY